jgi:hypothetical protein
VRKVFLGGSRRIPRLSESMRKKLDELIARRFEILVGDANGADRAMQQHLTARRYDLVTVYAVTGALRNNVGDWCVRHIDAPAAARGFALYSVKDVAMTQEADAGLMLWDGKSRGTLENVRRLLDQGKPVSLYVGPSRRFVSLRALPDLAKLGFGDAAPTAEQRVLPLGASWVRDRDGSADPRARRRPAARRR